MSDEILKKGKRSVAVDSLAGVGCQFGRAQGVEVG
jgi:hypothetical protein